MQSQLSFSGLEMRHFPNENIGQAGEGGKLRFPPSPLDYVLRDNQNPMLCDNQTCQAH